MATFEEALRFTFGADGTAEAEKLQSVLQGLGEVSAGLKEKLSPLIDELNSLGVTSQKVADAISLQGKLKENSAALATAKDALASLSAEFSRTDKSSTAVTVAFSQAEKQVKSLAAEQLKLQNASAAANGALKAAGVNTSDLAAAQADLKSKADGVAAKITDVANSASKAEKNLKGAGEGAKELGEHAHESAGLLGTLKEHLVEIVSIAGATELALKAIEFGTDAAKSAAAVEASLVRVQTLAQGAAGAFEELNKGLVDAAQETNTSTQAAAKGLSALAENGLSTDAAIKALIPTLQLAKIANIDTADAANQLTGVLDQFNLTADDAARVVDVLATASKGSQGALSGMTSELGKIAPLAKAAGLDLETTAGALGVLVRNGVSAKEAGSGLKAIFEGLIDPASKLRQNLSGLGDSTGNFGKAIETLTTSGPQGKAALLDLDGSARSVILALGQLGPGALQKFVAGLQNVNGAATITSKLLDDNLVGAANQFKNTIDRLAEALVEPILKPLQEEIVKLADSLDTFAKSQAFEEIKKSIASLATDGIAAFDSLIRGIDWSKVISDSQTAFTTISTALRDLHADLTIAGDTINLTMQGVTVALTSLQTAVFAIAAGISGALAAGAKGVELYLSALAKIPGAGAALKGVIEEVQTEVGGLTAVAEEFGNRAASSFDKLAAATQAFDEAAKKAAQHTTDVGEKILGVGKAAGDAVDPMDHFTSQLGLVPSYTNEAGIGVTRIIGPLGNAAEAAREAAAGVAAANSGFLELGGGPIVTAEAKLRAATAALSALVASGNATPLAMQAAVHGVNLASNELDRLRASAGKGKEATDALATAFVNLGLRAPGAIKEAADNAAAGFAKIQASFNAGEFGNNKQIVIDAFNAMAQKELDLAAVSDGATQQRIINELRAQAALSGTSAQLDALLVKYNQLQNNGNLYKPPVDGLKKVAGAARDAGDQIQKTTDTTKQAAAEISTLGADLAGVMEGARSHFAQFGEAATQAFDDALKGFENFEVAFNSQQAGGQYVKAVADAAAKVTATIENQKAQLETLVEKVKLYGDGGTEAFGAVGINTKRATIEINQQLQALDNGNAQFHLLGQNDLQTLRSALLDAKQKVEDLEQKARDAAGALKGMATSTQDEIDQINGDQAAVEKRRHETALQNIADQAKAAGQAGAQEAADAIKKENELYALKIANIEAQKKKADELKITNTSTSNTNTTTTNATTTTTTFAPIQIVHTFNLANVPPQINQEQISALVAQALESGEFAHAITEQVVSELQHSKMVS